MNSKNIFEVTGSKEDKRAIQETIDRCAECGGGTVVVPEGRWLSGKIHLKSNVCLHITDNAVISFSDDPEDYLPVVFTRWEGTECYNYSPLIYAKDCENIAITGGGTLLGNGGSWWHWKKLQQKAALELLNMAADGVPVSERVFGTEEAALRPQFIQPINCKNVLLEGFTVIDGPQWTIHPVYCENVTIRNVNVSTHGHNTDGLNPDSCKNVLIEGSTFETGDDCIAINSGLNEDGWRVDRPCENVEIRNCTMNGGHGAIVIGSAISGGVKNIYAHDCRVNGTMQGVRLKSMRGRGGYVDGAKFENVEINNVSDQAIQINMFYEFSTVMPRTDAPSEFSNIEISNVKGHGAKTGIQIKGLPERPLKNITLENIELTADEALVCSDAENINITNTRVRKGDAQ
ncbi:MAG: glycoside hydrolase family 28 protein [Clostridia bacterium]|nr:glycoside hydrolase family 28 protein [Clostridia bacterium]